MKKGILILMTVLMLSVFIGCSKDAEKVTKGSEAVTISWLDYNGYALDVMDAIFVELADQGINVELQHSANDYSTILKAKINAGDTPDVFVTESGVSNFTYAEYSYDLTGEPIMDKFLDWAVEACYADDKLVGIPVNIETFGIIYNKDVFESAGIAKIPTTQSEMKQVAMDLKEAGYSAFSNGYKETWVLFTHQASAFLMSSGLTPNEMADQLTAGELSFTEMDYFDRYLDYIDMTIEYGLPKALETDWETEEVAGATGKAAMFHMGNWCEAILTGANPDVNVAFIPMPVSEDPSESKVSSNIAWVAKVGADTKYKDEAITAIDHFLTSDSGLNYTIKNNKWILAQKEVVLQSDGMLVSSVNEIAKTSDPYSWAYTAWPDGFGDQGGVIIQSYIVGQKTREEVCIALDELWADLTE